MTVSGRSRGKSPGSQPLPRCGSAWVFFFTKTVLHRCAANSRPCGAKGVLRPPAGAGVAPPQNPGGGPAGKANVRRLCGGGERTGTAGTAAAPRAPGGRPAWTGGASGGGGGGGQARSGPEGPADGATAGRGQEAHREEPSQAGGQLRSAVCRSTSSLVREDRLLEVRVARCRACLRPTFLFSGFLCCTSRVQLPGTNFLCHNSFLF